MREVFFPSLFIANVSSYLAYQAWMRRGIRSHCTHLILRLESIKWCTWKMSISLFKCRQWSQCTHVSYKHLKWHLRHFTYGHMCMYDKYMHRHLSWKKLVLIFFNSSHKNYCRWTFILLRALNAKTYCLLSGCLKIGKIGEYLHSVVKPEKL